MTLTHDRLRLPGERDDSWARDLAVALTVMWAFGVLCGVLLAGVWVR